MRALRYDGPKGNLIVYGREPIPSGSTALFTDEEADRLLRQPQLHLTPVEAPAPAAVEPLEPPRFGPGSSIAAWSAYAFSLGITTGGLNRAEIIAAVDAHTAAQNDPHDEEADVDGDPEPEADDGEGPTDNQHKEE